MLDALTEAVGPEFVPAVLWTLLALVILVVVLIIVRLVRGMTFGTFVAGGRNRKTRLAVMDATAVDSHRRLVLVRRDDVEHLILIGGPTDVVVEQNIRLGQQQRRPQQPEAAFEPLPLQRAPEPAPVAAVPPRPANQQQRPPAPAAREQRNAPAPAPRAADRAPAPPPAQAKPPLRAVPPPPRAEPALRDTTRDTYLPRDLQGGRTPTPAPRNTAADLDKALVDELNVSLDEAAPPKKPAKEVSLEDEMNKLLGELTSKRQA